MSSLSALSQNGPQSRILQLNADVLGCICSLLDPRGLAALEATSRALRHFAFACWKTQAIREGMEPESLPSDISYCRMFKNLYPGSFGPRFYKDYFGGNALPVAPIPRAYIEASNRPDLSTSLLGKIKDNFQAVFLPEFIRIVIDVNSPLVLDANGRLIEDPLAVGVEREPIDVPVTLNNMAMLAEKGLKRGAPTGFSEQSWRNILAQHGDTRIKSHWFYPRKDVIALNQSYAEQQGAAARAGLEITPLIDTAIYYLFRRIRLGDAGRRYIARTSTSTLDNDNPPNAWPSSLWWPASGPAARLHLSPSSHFRSFGNGRVGVAVGVPAGSSQAIGP